MVAMIIVATMMIPKMDDTTEWADEEGALSASTSMTSIIWRATQWSTFLQTYHFLPSVFSWITPYPLGSASFSDGKVELWKSLLSSLTSGAMIGLSTNISLSSFGFQLNNVLSNIKCFIFWWKYIYNKSFFLMVNI